MVGGSVAAAVSRAMITGPGTTVRFLSRGSYPISTAAASARLQKARLYPRPAVPPFQECQPSRKRLTVRHSPSSAFFPVITPHVLICEVQGNIVNDRFPPPCRVRQRQLSRLCGNPLIVDTNRPEIDLPGEWPGRGTEIDSRFTPVCKPWQKVGGPALVAGPDDQVHRRDPLPPWRWLSTIWTSMMPGSAPVFSRSSGISRAARTISFLPP